MATDLRDRLTRAVTRDGPPSSDYDLTDMDPPEGVLADAAVMIPVLDLGGAPQMLLTKRANHLRHHPGQVALPGGRRDAGETVVEAALREAHEEVGLPPEACEVIGTLPAHRTVTRFTVTPVICLIDRDFNIRPEPGEVEEVFSVPFETVTTLANYMEQGRVWQGQMRLYYTVPVGPFYIWGATARILRGLSDRLAP